jgi:hypothetical protein
MTKKNDAALVGLIEEITTDAYGDDEQFWAFRQALQDHIRLTADALLAGEPVSVIAFDYDGNPRRGLTAKCRRPGGRPYAVAAADVALLPGVEGADYLAAYLKWLGLPPQPARSETSAVSPPELDLDLSKPVELVVLAM